LTAAGVERDFGRFETRYPIVKTFRFAIAGVLGFVVTEAVLAIGILLVYGKLGIPRASFSSVGLLILDVLSLVVGVSASFVINERITVVVVKAPPNKADTRLRRFMRFQAVSGVGNAGIVIVQFVLLTTLAISPLLGTMVGAVVTYPIVYFVSIKYVWKGHHAR
jgi:putative flippase GtrA